MKKVQVKVVREKGVELPKYETEGSAGMDVRANIKEPITLKSLEKNFNSYWIKGCNSRRL